MQRSGKLVPWASHSWNPIRMRCTPVSSGCKNCWHIDYCDRHQFNLNFCKIDREIYAGRMPFALRYDEIMHMLRTRTTGIAAVQLMGDLFHEKVSDELITLVMSVIRERKDWRFFLCTKRVERATRMMHYCHMGEVSNVCLLASVEDQQTTNRLIKLINASDDLPMIGASVEPMLERIDFDWSYLDFVAVGPETGKKARPCPDGAVDRVIDFCLSKGVPVCDKREPARARQLPKGWTMNRPTGRKG